MVALTTRGILFFVVLLITLLSVSSAIPVGENDVSIPNQLEKRGITDLLKKMAVVATKAFAKHKASPEIAKMVKAASAMKSGGCSTPTKRSYSEHIKRQDPPPSGETGTDDQSGLTPEEEAELQEWFLAMTGKSLESVSETDPDIDNMNAFLAAIGDLEDVDTGAAAPPPQA